jgi:hypothetical protein
MRQTWERKEKCARFWWESLKEGDHSEDQGVDRGMGSMDLREIGWGVEWIQLVWDRD